MQPAQPAAAQTLLTLRILFFALIAGVATFGVLVVLVLRPTPSEADPSAYTASLVALAGALVVAWFVVSRVLRRGLRARVAEAGHDEAPAILHRGFFTTCLVGGAMAEAFSFFALVVYMLTASPMALVAAGLGLLALLIQVPTADRLHRFMEEAQGHGPS